jgi:hypothetical protein
MNNRLRIAALAALVAVAGACATLQQMAALGRVDFELAGVGDGRLAGVDLARISSYGNLTALEVGRIAVALAGDDLPLEFRVDVRGLNPADNKVTARLVQLSWTLRLNDRETISGLLDDPVAFPPGEPVTIPMTMRLDVVDFFEGSAPDLVNLAAAIAGLDADPAAVSLQAVPTIETPLGPISYPSPITIKSRVVGGARRP